MDEERLRAVAIGGDRFYLYREFELLKKKNGELKKKKALLKVKRKSIPVVEANLYNERKNETKVNKR